MVGGMQMSLGQTSTIIEAAAASSMLHEWSCKVAHQSAVQHLLD